MQNLNPLGRWIDGSGLRENMCSKGCALPKAEDNLSF